MARFIDRFDVLLFDVCGTLVYDYDRFGPSVDYYSTYTQLAGNFLSPQQLSALINRLHATIAAAEKIEANYDPFPSLHEFALRANHSGGFPPGELERVEAVFARHEFGEIPDEIAAAVRRLRESHPLAIVSNLWGQAEVFEAELTRYGIRELFSPRVWSPQVGCIKPAWRIFQAALDALDVPPERVLYTGDVFLRDMVGAKRVGMAAAWINPAGQPVPEQYGIQPDLVIPDVTALLSV